MILMRQIEKNHYESILTSLDKCFPELFDKFWEWNESKMWAKNLSIFDKEFIIWLKHLTPSTDTQTKYNYTPRNEKDNFFGIFEQCVLKITRNEWVQKFFFRSEFALNCIGFCVCHKRENLEHQNLMLMTKRTKLEALTRSYCNNWEYRNKSQNPS